MSVAVAPEPEADPVMRDLGVEFTALKKAGNWSFKRLGYAVWRIWSDDDPPSHETIRQLHQGIGKANRANLGLVAALCIVYKVPMADVSPELARRAEVVKQLLTDATVATDRYPLFVHPCLPLADGWDQLDGERLEWTTRQSLTDTESGNEHVASPAKRSAATAPSTDHSSHGSKVAA